MKISAADWKKYVKNLAQINKTAADKMQAYVDEFGMDDMEAVVNYGYALATKYGEATGELACEMYDAIAAASGKTFPPAEMAPTATYGETAKAIYGTVLNKQSTVPATVGRLTKQVGADTTLRNALRDGAKFAWIPNGDTCAFCITLASRGWQRMSKKALRNGHAEHIHPNCDCEYAISFDKDPHVEGYNPEEYLKIYNDAKGGDPNEKINYIRRGIYAQQKKPGTTTQWSGEKLKAVLGEDDYKTFEGLVNKSETKKLYERYSESPQYYNDDRGYYMPAADAVHFGYETHPGMSKYSTLAHENGHMFDAHIGKSENLSFKEVDLINEKCAPGARRPILGYYPSSSDEFLTALRKDMETLHPKVSDRSIKELFSSTDTKRNATSGIQDALDGFYSTQKNGILPWGHGDSYYNRQYNRRFKLVNAEQNLKSALTELGLDASNLTKTKRISRQYEAASETWANISSAVTCGGEELDAFKEYMPETYKAYIDILGRV